MWIRGWLNWNYLVAFSGLKFRNSREGFFKSEFKRFYCILMAQFPLQFKILRILRGKNLCERKFGFQIFHSNFLKSSSNVYRTKILMNSIPNSLSIDFSPKIPYKISPISEFIRIYVDAYLLIILNWPQTTKGRES